MTSAPTPQAPMPQAPPPGLTVDGYELRARLGEGGMGVVHLGQRPGERPVALKVLRPHIVGDEEARQRLAREVSSLERIRSRRIAEIVDADPWGDIPYVATRYVPGLSLHDHVREEGALEGSDLVWFAQCLAEALTAVHAVGVVHRDIKPSNVVMEGRSPVLIDFGLARVADDPRLTMTGWLLGTPGYLAPEILHGEDATPASDVHAWAATAAFAGLGRAPFGSGPSMAVMDRVRRGEHDLDGLDPRVRALVEHALAPRASDRPSLSEVHQWLSHLADGRASQLSTPQHDAAAPIAPTKPILAVLHEEREAETRDVAGPTRHGVTRILPDGSTEWVSQDYVAAPAPTGLAERLRRTTLTVAAGLVVAGAVALAPYIALLVVLVLVWLLRSGSLAASALQRRRDQRGLRWYDSSIALLSAPWHLVAGIGGTLLLGLWSLGITVAAALLCFAAALETGPALAVMGFSFALALWSGPGSERLRSPVRRVLQPVARRGVPWGLALLLVLALASALGAAAATGTHWAPALDAPFADVRLPSWL